MDYSYKPTTHGRAVMATCMALEKPLKITRVAFGSGRIDEGVNLADVHELLEYVSDGAVAERRHEDNRFCLTIQYANTAHPDVKTFMLSEFIVYAHDPDNGGETDLLYGTLGDYRQPVPAYNPAYGPSVFNFPLVLVLSDEVNVSIASQVGLVTYQDLERVIDALGVRQQEITIPADGWQKSPESICHYRRDIAVEGVTQRLIPRLILPPESMEEARNCALSTVCETLDGAVRVWAESAPARPIRAVLQLTGNASGYIKIDGWGNTSPASISKGLTYTADGRLAVKIGDGLTFDKSDAVAVDGSALSEEAAAALTEALTESDENAAKMIDEVYG